ncbi:uncharacterized protein LOC6032163 isoform X1 [Culex quinquefasciatus]|uniref:uncharacterized protein LOC6032163 isoform X1 n=1 Tax=Culex quinquefasciatus TaxID=7176 RepID=UPI0018E2F446|nr:uncharacterized protein LOC6032163 isoform X1 [Culex quinquefasciatus]XP_039443117.1 uncharacterized protein LOC120423394 isoform X1 [Culex pipiens pallens]
MDRAANRDNTTEFIQIWESEPSLYSANVNLKEGKDKAFKRLVAKLREVNPDADRYAVIKKIASLRSNYRREAKVVKENPDYEPSLWYFPLVHKFLKDDDVKDESYSGDESITAIPEDVLVDFIAILKSEPAVWRTKSWQYRDQDLKAAGFARLVERLQQVRPTADRWATIKMINVMRKKFLIEWRRVREDPAYEPGLWYYDEISFIKDYDQPVPGEEDIKPAKVPVRKTKAQILNKRKVLREFIQLYESEPTLWKVNSKQYRNRELKAEAYQKLANKLKEIQPDADAYAVVKQINSLRSPYRKEIKKIRANPNYRTTLWYFDLLAFLDNEGEESSEEDQEEDDESEKYHPEDTNDGEEEAHEMCDEEDYMIEFKPHSPEKDVKPPRKIQRLMIERLNEPEASSVDPLTVNMSGHSNDTSAQHSSFHGSYLYQPPAEDRFDVYGRNVAMKLRQLPNDQRMLAEKAINDVLFEAEMGTLQRAGPAHYAVN